MTTFSFKRSHRPDKTIEVDLGAENLDYIIAKLPHTTSLTTTSSRVAAVVQQFKLPMHHLTFLDIRSTEPRPGPGDPPDFLYLPEDTFGGMAPLLDTLHLGRCLLSWNAPILQNLTFLMLSHDHPSRPYYPPTPHDFYVGLEQMQSLEELHLSYCLPRAGGIHLSRRAHLAPGLHTLSVCGSVSDAYDLLRNLAVPQGAVIDIRCNGDIKYIRPLLESVVNHNSKYKIIRSPYLTKLIIEADLEPFNHNASYPIALGILGDWDAAEPSECPFMFYYEGDDTRQTKAASITVLETAARLHQFQRITDLHLLAESDFQPVRSWPELFAPGWAQHVKDIKLVNRVGPRCIWEILGPPPPSAHIRSPVLFPKLRELHLSDIAFWRPDARAGSNNTAERAELLPALERYSSLGRRLNAIVIRNCECRWLWINDILRWAPVKWDRVQCSERLSMERHRVPLPNNGVVPEDNYHALYDQSVPRFSLEVIKKAPSEPWP